MTKTKEPTIRLSLICEHTNETEGIKLCAECTTELLKGAALWAGTVLLCLMIAAGQR